MKTTTVSAKRFAGMTLIEVLTVLAVLFVLAAVLLPALAAPRRRVSRIGCVNCLKEIGLAYRIWEGDNGDKYPFAISVTNGGTMEVADQAWQTFAVMSNVLSTPKILTCPNDTSRWQATNFGTDFPSNHVSYFVGLDGDDNHPRGILSGDDNLAVGGVRLHSGRFTVNTHALPVWTADRHKNCGNLGLGDGSVQQDTDAGLAGAVLNASDPTNQVRLVMP